jgi:hypothetical protein
MSRFCDRTYASGRSVSLGSDREYLRESHPELLEDFFEHALDEQSSSPGDFGAQMAQALFMSIIDSAEELYHGQCQ